MMSMQALYNVSMEEVRQTLASSHTVLITIECEGVTSEHIKQDDGRWSTDGIQTPGQEDDGFWSQEEFAAFIADISIDCVEYTIQAK
jgi:hypothetical protein